MIIGSNIFTNVKIKIDVRDKNDFGFNFDENTIYSVWVKPWQYLFYKSSDFSLSNFNT